MNHEYVTNSRRKDSQSSYLDVNESTLDTSPSPTKERRMSNLELANERRRKSLTKDKESYRPIIVGFDQSVITTEEDKKYKRRKSVEKFKNIAVNDAMGGLSDSLVNKRRASRLIDTQSDLDMELIVSKTDPDKSASIQNQRRLSLNTSPSPSPLAVITESTPINRTKRNSIKNETIEDSPGVLIPIIEGGTKIKNVQITEPSPQPRKRASFVENKTTTQIQPSPISSKSVSKKKSITEAVNTFPTSKSRRGSQLLG